MQVQDAVERSGIPRSEAEILLCALLRKDRTWILAHPEGELQNGEGERWREWVARRHRGEPVAFIRGFTEFFGRAFTVRHGVLIPRPSTEGLVELALEFFRSGEQQERVVETGITALALPYGDVSHVQTVVDVGTGSGCIAVTIALECPSFSIIATDTSDEALLLAGENAERHSVMHRIEFRAGSFLEPVAGLCEPFIVVTNPPYLAVDTPLLRDVREFEPSAALFGGYRGNELLHALLQQTREHPWCRGIVLECLDSQRSSLLR